MSSDQRLEILYNFYDTENEKNDINFLSQIEQLPEDKLIHFIFKKNIKKFNILEATQTFLEQFKNNESIYKKQYKKRKLK
jgi:hypothetical protein